MIRTTITPPPGPQPRVSVVVPCYNYGRYLRSCVESVLGQEGVAVDVTIIDDASTDHSVSVAEELCQSDDRVRLVRHTHNRGHIVTFNDALAEATAEFVVKMDADDLVPPLALARSVRLLAAYPQMSFAYGHPQTFSDDPPSLPRQRQRPSSVWAGQEWISLILRRAHNVIMQPEVVMRRSALEMVGGHRAAVPEASDFNLWLRLASVGSVGRVNGTVQGQYRIHDQSMQRTIHAGYLSDLRARRAAIDLFLAECTDRLDDPESLRRIAHSALARDARRLANRAYDLGAESTEPIAEYLAVAAELDPRPTRGSRRGRLRLAGQLSPARLYRETEDRILWRRWRRYGT